MADRLSVTTVDGVTTVVDRAAVRDVVDEQPDSIDALTDDLIDGRVDVF